MPIPKSVIRTFTLFICGATTLAVAGCSGGGGLADSQTASRTVSVANGDVTSALTDQESGSVSNPRVGLVAYATGIDQRRGQIVAVAGIADGATVGDPVNGGTVTYDTRYNYQVADRVARSSSFISGQRATRRIDGQTTLTADFGTGRLTGNTSDLSVNGRINGKAVSGSAVVNYSLPTGLLSGNRLSGSVATDLNGQIGSEGVIATFEGTDDNTAVAGGLVGTAN